MYDTMRPHVVPGYWFLNDFAVPARLVVNLFFPRISLAVSYYLSANMRRSDLSSLGGLSGTLLAFRSAWAALSAVGNEFRGWRNVWCLLSRLDAFLIAWPRRDALVLEFVSGTRDIHSLT